MAALKLGADRYIKKPSNLEEFLSVGGTLKEMLSEERSDDCQCSQGTGTEPYLACGR